MKKKILFLGRFAPPMHGAAKMNELYFNSLSEDKNLGVMKIKLNKYNSLDNIGKIDRSKIIGYLKTIKELISKIKKFDPEIIYLEMAPRGIAFFKDSIFILISKIFRKKIFIQFHAKGAKETTRNRFARLYYNFIFKNTKIILLSKILFNDIENVAGRRQVRILPNGIPNELTNKEFEKILEKRSKNKKPIFLFLSNMIESKGPVDTLKICNELNKERIDFECNFVGKFQDEEFKKYFEKKLKNFNLEKKCKYLGPMYGEDKKRILEKSNLLIFPTKYNFECYPLVILESFMYGIPVFSYDNGAIKEIVSKKYLGYVSTINNWKELSGEIKKKIKKKPYYSSIRNYFKSNYSYGQTIKSMKKILLGVVDKKHFLKNNPPPINH